MFKVKIIKNAQEVQHCLFDTLEAAQKWEADLAENKSWGKPAGFYPISQLSQEELAQEISRKEVDELGNPVEVMVEIPAQYSLVTEDITALVAQQAINAEALAFLNATDFKVWRHRDQVDAGLPTSLSAEEYAELLAERQMARDRVVR